MQWLKARGVGKYYTDSKVEISGFLARHYDSLLNFATFGMYAPFIKKAIEYIGIQEKDKILDIGCGSGRNACLMRNYLSKEGSITGIDISEEMACQFTRNCDSFPNIKLLLARADKVFPFKDRIFDKILISFFIHGFPQSVRKHIIKEAHRVLKNRGKIFILDYNQFIFEKSPIYVKVFFKAIECPYAFDFIKRNWKKTLSEKGFGLFKEKLFFKNYVRILRADKVN